MSSLDDLFDNFLGSLEKLHCYYQENLPSNELEEFDSIIKNYHSHLIRYARELDEGPKSEAAHLVLANIKPSLSQYIIDDKELIENINLGLSDDSIDILLFRPIEILTHIFEQEQIEIHDSELFDSIVKTLKYCCYTEVQELFEVLLATSPHTDKIQQCLIRANMMDWMIQHFNMIDQLNVNNENDERIIYGICIITSYLAKSSEMRNLVFTEEFFQSKVLFYFEGMSNFLQNGRWEMLKALICDETEGMFISGEHNFIQECLENLSKASDGPFPEYLIKCIQFLQFFLKNHASEMTFLELPNFFISLMNQNPNHYYLISSIKDFFYQGIETPDIQEQMAEMIPYFAESLGKENYNMRSFAIEVLINLQERKEKDETIAALVASHVPDDDPVWTRIEEIKSICSIRAAGSEYL